MPILGTVASQFAGKPFSSFESIATVSVGAGGQSSIEFTSIPATYKHLQIRGIAQTNRTTYGTDSLYARFNGDSGTNYADHWIRGDGSVAAAGNYAPSSNLLYISYGGSGTGVSGVYGVSIIDILDYASTNKYKTTKTRNGTDINGTIAGYGGFMFLSSGLWMSTSAISSITITPDGNNFNQHSSFALYGIKGA